MTRAKREPYEPPRIRRVRLAADDLAATGCKAVRVGPDTCRRANGPIVNKKIGS